MREGDWQQARLILTGFLERMKTSDHMYRDTMAAAAACILGDVYLREDAIEDALTVYHRAWHILQERRSIVGHARLCARTQAGLATAYARQGNRDRAAGLLAKAVEAAEASTSFAHSVQVLSLPEQFYTIGVAQLALGAAEEATRTLRRAVASGWRDTRWLRRDRMLAPLNSSPEFPEIVESAGRFPPVSFSRE
jgi:tetratricopeptide (TPR) repeat protein